MFCRDESDAGVEVKAIDDYKRVFERFGGMMRTKDLLAENILYRPLQKLIRQGYVEKVRYGYYRWADDDFSEASVVVRLFPDAIFCMDTALYYYGYSDRVPSFWNLAESRDSGKSRFRIAYPFVKPYYFKQEILELGLTTMEIDGRSIRIYDKDRVICDCVRYRNKMDKEIFNKAIRGYIEDPGKNIPRLLEYSEKLRVKNIVKSLIGLWL